MAKSGECLVRIKRKKARYPDLVAGADWIYVIPKV